ncbi:hypothetical protein NKG94_38370 [Micromonospora sp. M12]
MVDHTHALSFGAAASDYDRFRPRYPEAAVRWALDGLSNARVVDLAAGTGILSRAVLALGHEVVPVEPDPGMRAQLADSTPGTTAWRAAPRTCRCPTRRRTRCWSGRRTTGSTGSPRTRDRPVLRPGGTFAPSGTSGTTASTGWPS